MLRTTALAFAIFVGTSALGAEALAQANARRLPTLDSSTFANPGARRPVALTVPKRGPAVWTPGLGRTPEGMRTVPPPTARFAARAPIASIPAWSSRPDGRAPRTLSFFNTHTGESIIATYARDGNYVPAELARLSQFLRDSRNETRVAFDPALFDILWEVHSRLGSTASYHVLSGYRSPTTNAWLASVSRGVAFNSLHMRGQAIDVMLPGHSAAQLGAAGLALNRGGVGYYPTSGFVHFDTGPARFW